jgi:predicted nucleic acid-binding protein
MPRDIPDYLIDTSVAIKWFIERNEANVKEARLLRDAYLRRRCNLRAPDLLVLEFANALAFAHRREKRQVREALQSLQEIAIDLLPFEWKTLGGAVELAAALQVAVYDAYFLAMAVVSGVQLVTADDAFLRRVKPHPNALALHDLQLAD